MRLSRKFLSIAVSACFLTACQSPLFDKPTAPTAISMASIAAVRLNFRYEADVPAPPTDAGAISGQERDAAVQADFDANRSYELLDRTLPSPDKRFVLAVYHHIADTLKEYRLDLYTPDGKLQRKLTSDAMAVHFPDTIVWAPDSTTVAFVAMARAKAATPTGSPASTQAADPAPSPVNLEPEETPSPQGTPMAAAPTGILTFSNEQIYLAQADGSGTKPLTENEGMLYFYYAWSPDSKMLVALATTKREWEYSGMLADSQKQTMVPTGRPRVIERNGRERRLDDNPTAVRPVFSPDSTKVAAAFGQQVRIYDAGGTTPTQAAIPLRNQLLLSAQAFDRKTPSTDTNVGGTSTPDQPVSTLPDEKLLLSFYPIVELVWTADELLYLQTASLKQMANEVEVVSTFSRWHRLVLSPQAVAPTR